MNSIYQKLVVYFLALNLFAIGAIGTYSYYKEKDALLLRTFDQLITVRQEKKNRITTFFRQRIRDMENIVLIPDVQKLFLNPSHKQSVPGLFPHLSLADIQEYLSNAGCYQKLLVLLHNNIALGMNVESKNKKFYVLPSNKKQSLIKLQKELGNNRKCIIKEIYFNHTDNLGTLILARNIFDHSGLPAGTIVLEIKQEAINNVMYESGSNSGLGKTGEVYLIGKDGLMRSNSRFIKNSVFETRINTPGAKNALKGITGQGEFHDYRNIPVLSAYCPLNFSGIHWALLAEIDAKEAMVPIYSIRDNIIYLSLLIALLSAAVITFLSSKFSGPIKKLKDETTKIAGGEYGNSISVKTHDEIGELTSAFNEMSIRLKKQADRLEEEKKLRLRSVIDAQEEERQRLSRELHDGLGPLLLAGKMKLESVRNARASILRKTIDEVMNLFSDTVQEIRYITNNMMPSGLKEFGLVTALQNFCQQVMDVHQVKIHLMLELNRDHYEKEVEIYLFRIAQEAVNNVLKHASAKEIHLSIEEINGHLYFTFMDDGCGFDEKNQKFHRGNGLVNMKERVNLLNGYFELTTTPGKGTRIDIDIPVL